MYILSLHLYLNCNSVLARIFNRSKCKVCTSQSKIKGGHGFEAPAQRHHIPAKFPLPTRPPTQPRAPPLPLPLPLVLARIRAQETLETLIPCHGEKPSVPNFGFKIFGSPFFCPVNPFVSRSFWVFFLIFQRAKSPDGPTS